MADEQLSDYTKEKPLPDASTCIRCKLVDGEVMWKKEGAHYWAWVSKDGKPTNELRCGACGLRKVANARLVG